MQRAKKFTLLALSALVMTACGGSGGGGSDESKTEVNPQTTVENMQTASTETTQPSTSPEPAQPTVQPVQSSSVKQLTAEYFVNGKTSTSSLQTSTNTDPKVIIVDGQPISIMPTLDNIQASKVEINTGRFIQDGKHVVKNTEALTYGLALVNNSSFALLFVQGEQTPDSAMPIEGRFKYEGPAIISNKVNSIDGKGNTTLTYDAKYDAKFDVDFGLKQVDGSVEKSLNDTQKLVVTFPKMTIEGNGFSGKDTQNINTMKAKFYGDKAQEIGGTIENDQQIGVFGASQEK